MLQREAHRCSQWELNLNERIPDPGLQKLAYGRFPVDKILRVALHHPNQTLAVDLKAGR